MGGVIIALLEEGIPFQTGEGFVCHLNLFVKMEEE